MKKISFYIYQEDLIKYETEQEYVTISQLVCDLNQKYCTANMLRLRTETITEYLKEQNYLCVDKNNKKYPTPKGRILGITVGSKTDEKGNKYVVNLYNKKAQQYILDNLYNIIFS